MSLKNKNKRKKKKLTGWTKKKKQFLDALQGDSFVALKMSRP